MMKRFVFSLIIFLIAADAAQSFTLSSFETPESIIVDPENGYYYVSNINGNPTDKDGNGYISKINPSGSVSIQRFIASQKDQHALHAPKGLLVIGKNIFVTDIDTVKGFDKETGKASVLVDLSKLGVKFLNDLATDGKGMIYASDMMTNQIFKIDSNKDYQASVYAGSVKLGGPNGLVINPKNKNLMVVTFKSGRILEIDRDGDIHVIKRGLTTLDGLDHDRSGNLYVSSFEKGEIYKIPNYGRGTIKTWMNGLTTPADISYDRKKDEVLIPSMKGNSVTTLPALKSDSKK